MAAGKGSSRKHTLAFSRVALRNWRNFESAEVDLQRRAFLVGPNASGKTNFLDVFRFLRDLVSDGLEKAVERRDGVSRLRCLAARRFPEIAVQVRLAEADGSDSWEYHLHFSQDKRQRPIVTKEVVQRVNQVILHRPNADDANDPERLTQTFIQQVNANRDFRVIAEFLAETRYLHLVPQLVRYPERYGPNPSDPFGSDILDQIAGLREKDRDSRLKKIGAALKIAVPQLQTLEFYRDERGSPHLRGRYEHWRERGAWQSERQFSDGTLRLLGLLWSAMDGAGPLLLEEPELSLHADIVRFLPQLLARMQSRSGRQMLISTHSFDLLRDEGIALDEVLLLTPGREGTDIATAASRQDIRHLLEGGVPLADAIQPHTRPTSPEQLMLFEL